MTPQALLALLQQHAPELVPVYQAIMQQDTGMAQKMAGLFASGQQGMQQVLQMLLEASQAGPQGAAPRNDGPPPPGGQPPPQGAPPGIIPGGGPSGQVPSQLPPGPPGGPPPGVGPGGPGGPPAPPPPDLKSQLPPDLLKVYNGLTPGQQQQLQQGYQQAGIQPVLQLLAQLAAQGGPKQALGGGGQAPARAARQQGQRPPREKKERAAGTPKFTLRPLPKNRWGDSGPSYQRVIRDAEDGKRRYKQRDLRIAEDIEMYNLSRARGRQGAAPLDPGAGDVVHTSSRPWQFVERLTGLCTASNGKLTTRVPAWSDDDDTRFAAQGEQDWLVYSREYDEELWFRTGATSDPRQPLPRLEAALMALMGGYGFRIDFVPEDKNCPVRYIPIPLNRLYPLAHAVTHQTSGPLEEMRSIYPEIDEYYPPEDEGGPTGTETVEIIGWTDVYGEGRGGLWHCIAWKIGGDWGGPDERQQEKWIKQPTRIDFGFPVYHYVVWGGAPYWSTQSDTGIATYEYERYRGMGVLTQLRKTFNLLDALMSAVATGAFRAQDPALIRYYAPGTRKEDMEPLDTSAGTTNFGYIGESVQPLQFAVANGPDFQALYQQIANELADLDSPMLKGAQGESGYQQTMLGNAAGSIQIGPIIDALERAYQLVNTLKLELVIRKGIGKGREIEALPYTSKGHGDYATDYDVNYEQVGVMRYITPKQVELNGTRNTVRFHRLSTQEQQMLWNMWGQAVSQKMMSARQAMEKMDIANPDRELFQILQEAAVSNPKALDAMIGAAALSGGNELFSLAWQKVIEQQQAPPPPQPGIPSAAAPPPVTGGPQGAPPTIAPTQP